MAHGVTPQFDLAYGFGPVCGWIQLVGSNWHAPMDNMGSGPQANPCSIHSAHGARRMDSSDLKKSLSKSRSKPGGSMADPEDYPKRTSTTFLLQSDLDPTPVCLIYALTSYLFVVHVMFLLISPIAWLLFKIKLLSWSCINCTVLFTEFVQSMGRLERTGIL